MVFNSFTTVTGALRTLVYESSSKCGGAEEFLVIIKRECHVLHATMLRLSVYQKDLTLVQSDVIRST